MLSASCPAQRGSNIISLRHEVLLFLILTSMKKRCERMATISDQDSADIDDDPQSNQDSENKLFDKLESEQTSDRNASASATSLSRLEAKVEKLEDQLKAYKFSAIFIGLFVLDCWLFNILKTTAAIVCLFIFQLIALFILARRLGIEEIDVIADKVSSIFGKRE